LKFPRCKITEIHSPNIVHLSRRCLVRA
jgi:hypothetical protein